MFSTTNGVPNTGTYEMENCFIAKCTAQYDNCDPRIIMTWSGTDSSGKYIRSSASSFRQFENFTAFEKLWPQSLELDLPDSVPDGGMDQEVVDAINNFT